MTTISHRQSTKPIIYELYMTFLQMITILSGLNEARWSHFRPLELMDSCDCMDKLFQFSLSAIITEGDFRLLCLKKLDAKCPMLC